MNQAPKQPNIFGPVLGAILVAAAIGGIIFGIYTLHSQVEATDKARDNLRREIARTDTFLRLRNSPAPSETPPPAPAPTFMITLTAPVPIQTESGTVTLPIGTKLQFVSQINNKVHVHYLNSDYLVPLSATDLKLR